MRSLLLAATMLLPASLRRTAATLRPMTTLHAPVVLLSDLFDDAGRHAERVLGPGAGAGRAHRGRGARSLPRSRAVRRRLAPDLAGRSGGARAPGQGCCRARWCSARCARRSSAWARPPSATSSCPASTPPLVPVDTKPEASIEQLDYDAESARFTAGLLVTGEGMAPMRLRLTGTRRGGAGAAGALAPAGGGQRDLGLRPGDGAGARACRCAARWRATSSRCWACGCAGRRRRASRWRWLT